MPLRRLRSTHKSEFWQISCALQACEKVDKKGDDLGPRDDDVLPDSLGDALARASKATIAAIARGNNRCQVEVLLSEFWDPISGPLFSDEGDQQRWWKLSRRFIEELSSQSQYTQAWTSSINSAKTFSSMMRIFTESCMMLMILQVSHF